MKGIFQTITATSIVIIALAGIAWLYPLLAEGTGLPCGALANRSAALHAAHNPSFNNVITMGVVRTVGDFTVSQMVSHSFPSLPPEVVCVAYYWYLTVDPDSVEFVWSDLQSSRPIARSSHSNFLIRAR